MSSLCPVSYTHLDVYKRQKQYRVQKGDVINVEKIVPKRKNQKKVTFDEVLMVNEDSNVLVGTPVVEGYKVEGKILEQGKSEKVIVYKYKAKKDYRRKQGHRQPCLLYTSRCV